ncbi:MAG: ergothioneine biosynthesis protein EgtB [Chloroflexota bacterium]
MILTPEQQFVPDITQRPSYLTAEYLLERYQAVRAFTEKLCEPLANEDYMLQSMEDVSPTKWHIAHTSWFFEQFVLLSGLNGYKALNETYFYLFNSYYVAAGQRHCRPKRGLISRPTVAEVFEYRKHVDKHMVEMIKGLEGDRLDNWAEIIELGTHHEQQHQELMVTDIKHNLSINPLLPALIPSAAESLSVNAIPLNWIEFDEGIYDIGFEGEEFLFDNETPRHRAFVEPFALTNRLITNGEWLEFIEDGGYQRHELWLTAGFGLAQKEEWDSPLYWQNEGDGWYVFTLGGLKRVNLAEPVSHITYYEADAFARWADARLPTEFEWEIASRYVNQAGNFVESGVYHPAPLDENADPAQLHQMFGDVWEWTQSHYSPYPGFKTVEGALGEYNGKFMANQFVLRGGSVATSETHIRPTYRNFWHPDTAFQFTGLRLAKRL